MATECFKMSEFTQKHSPLFIFRLFFFGESSHLLEFCVLLEIARFICETNLEHAEFKNTSLAKLT